MRLEGGRWRGASYAAAMALGLGLCPALDFDGGLEAQAIQGAVVDAEAGSPIVGAVILLLDEEGVRRGAVLSAQDGSFRFHGPVPARYRLKAEMIGRRSVEAGPFEWRAHARHELSLPAEAIRLGGLDVTGEERCSVEAESARAVYAVWSEVEKALRATEVTRSTTDHRFRVVEYDRARRKRNLAIVDESSTEKIVVGTERPFTSLSPTEVETEGYVRVEDDYFWIYGPSAEVLLSPHFIRTHCFTLRRDGGRRGEIGMAFEPVEGRDVPELRGVLWIEDRSARLRALEFEYVHLPRTLMNGEYTGAMEFRPLEGGGLIVGDWWLRSPDPDDLNQLREQAGSVLGVLPGR